jgi:hypothetical protein
MRSFFDSPEFVFFLRQVSKKRVSLSEAAANAQGSEMLSMWRILVSSAVQKQVSLSVLARARNLSVSAVFAKDKSPIADSTTVLYINADNEKSKMSFAEIKAMAGESDRTLIKVGSKRVRGNADAELPAFKFMNAHELETAVSKARRFATGQWFDRFDSETATVEGRIKEKKFILRTVADKQTVSYTLATVIKALEKGKITKLTIERKKGKHAEEAKDMEKEVRAGLKEVLDADERRMDSLFIDIKEGK